MKSLLEHTATQAHTRLSAESARALACLYLFSPPLWLVLLSTRVYMVSITSSRYRSPMPGQELRLLALDGGGVRGLSSLIILERLMESIDPDSPPKPCDYFDIIGGTSTGG